MAVKVATTFNYMLTSGILKLGNFLIATIDLSVPQTLMASFDVQVIRLLLNWNKEAISVWSELISICGDDKRVKPWIACNTLYDCSILISRDS